MELQHAIDIIEDVTWNDNGRHYGEIDPARNIAIEAIRKRMPKKVKYETINRGIDISGEYDIDSNLLCPDCGSIVGTFESGENELFEKYCGDCGQALDASEDEEQGIYQRAISAIVNTPSEFSAEQATPDFLNGLAHRQNEIIDILKMLADEEGAEV